MPQLSPSPWFYILMITWFIFLTVVSYKVLSHTSTNDLSLITTENLQSNIWIWPWH